LPKKKPDSLRTSVLNLFEKHPSLSIKFNPLVKKLKLNKSEKAGLRDVLRSLVLDELLEKSGKYFELTQKRELYEGIIVLDREMEYAAEIKNESGFERIRIRKKNLQTAMVDDVVEISIIEFADRNFKEAFVERIVKRAKHRIVGKLEFAPGDEDYAFVVPDDRKFRKDIYIQGKNLKNASEGDKVVCEITSWTYQDASPEGKIVEVLGKAGDVKTEFRALIKKYGLTKIFPKKVRIEIKELSDSRAFEIRESEIKKRVNLRNIVTFTIDPIDAKDFDDAVSIELNEKGNYMLGVHIADVSHYVKENSELDKEALNRGTSVYLMNDVVPMLPEVLSNDICSLKQGVDRLTFSVFVEINSKGEILDFSISKSVINSKKRFTYEEVQKILDEQKGMFLKEINLMNELHNILFERRIKEGSLDFETQEVSVEIDPDGFIKNIKPKERLDSMRIIEDFMLTANKCVTLYIERKDPKPPFVYRIHDLPDKTKMRELSQFVKQFGITLNPDSKRSLQKMLLEIRGRQEEYLITDITIRSMAKAVYSESNIGHYGLGFKNYTHFTSPIRRYPDLVVHRILFDVLSGIESSHKVHYRNILPDVCRQSTDMELNAVQAEREAVRILQIRYLESHARKIFDGIVSGISEYGIYVEISENLIEGMVRLKDLNDDYYILDEKNFRLIGRHRKKMYRIGDRIKVKVLKTDIEKKWIDFIPVK
jgi:ribonuclease R